jgi:hypothetical protein
MRFAMPEGPPAEGRAVPVQVAVSHPNTSGLQMDQLTRLSVPAEFVRTVRIAYRDAEVMAIETDISIAENPTFGFALSGEPGGELRVEPRTTATVASPAPGWSPPRGDARGTRPSRVTPHPHHMTLSEWRGLLCKARGLARCRERRNPVGRTAVPAAPRSRVARSPLVAGPHRRCSNSS